MANVNAPFGFSPWRNGDASPYNGAANLYYIPSTDTNVYTLGDPVISLAGMDANGIPGVVIATGTSTVRGVIVGIHQVAPGPNASLVGTPLTLERIYAIGANKPSAYYVMVADDPNICFMAQMNNGTLPQAINVSANKNCSFVVNGTATGPQSAAVLSATTVAVTQGLNVKLLGLVNGPQNQGFMGTSGVDITSTAGQFSVWICKFNQHELMGNTAGI